MLYLTKMRHEERNDKNGTELEAKASLHMQPCMRQIRGTELDMSTTCRKQWHSVQNTGNDHRNVSKTSEAISVALVTSPSYQNDSSLNHIMDYNSQAYGISPISKRMTGKGFS